MDRMEVLETTASVAAGVGAAICYTILFVAMNLPVAETLKQILS